MKLYEKLADLRKSRHDTQAQLAKKLGVTRQTISKWEMGISQPSPEYLDKIADLYCCSVDELMGRNVGNVAEEKPTNENDRPIGKPKREKTPFWTINKEALFVFIVGFLVTVSYCVVRRFSQTTPSITVFLAAEFPVFALSAVITAISDTRIKTKGGMLDLILPLVCVVAVQIIFGIVMEH